MNILSRIQSKVRNWRIRPVTDVVTDDDLSMNEPNAAERVRKMMEEGEKSSLKLSVCGLRILR